MVSIPMTPQMMQNQVYLIKDHEGRRSQTSEPYTLPETNNKPYEKSYKKPTKWAPTSCSTYNS